MVNRKTKTFNIHRATNLKNTLSEKIAFINYIYFALALNLLNVIAVLLMKNNLPPQVPLFYGFTESEQQLTTSFGLLIPGVFSFLLTLGNVIFSIFIKNNYLKKILSITSFTISLLSLITVIKIIFLVGFF